MSIISRRFSAKSLEISKYSIMSSEKTESSTSFFDMDALNISYLLALASVSILSRIVVESGQPRSVPDYRGTT